MSTSLELGSNSESTNQTSHRTESESNTAPPRPRDSGGNALLEALRPKVQNVVKQQKNLLQNQLQKVAFKGLGALKGGEDGKTSVATLLRNNALSGVRERASGDGAQAADVRLHEGELAEQAVALGPTLKAKAETLAQVEADKHQEALKTAASAAVTTQTDTSPKAQKRGLKAAANAAAKKRKALYKSSRTTLGETIANDANTLIEGLSAGAKEKARTKAAEEMEARSDLNATVVAATDPAVEKAIKEIKASTTKYLAHKLGASGARWWRSKEVRAFRGQMKGAARDQGNHDVGEELNRQTDLGAMRKKYVAMDAKRRVYKKAKGSVETGVTKIASEAAGKITDNSTAATKLAADATGAAWGRLRVNEQDVKGAKKAADKAVSGAKKGVEKSVEAKAKAWKNRVLEKAGSDTGTGTSQGTSPGTAPSTDKEEMKGKVKEQTAGDKVGKKAVKDSIKATTIDKGLGKVGHLIDVAAPNSGDEVSLDVELHLPVPNSPAFIVIGFSGGAARDVESMALEVEAELRFGAGVEFVLGEGSATFGLFQRAGAATAAQTMTVFSYGAYRRLASGPAKKLASLWGGSGKGTDLKGAERSERWAAMVEEEIFAKDGDAFAEVGKSLNAGVGSTAAAHKLGVGTEIGARVEKLRRFDRESLTAAKYLEMIDDGQNGISYAVKDFSGDDKAKKRRRKAKRIAKSKNITLEGSIEREVLGRTVSLAGEFSFEDPENLEISVEASLPVGATEDAGMLEKIAGGVGVGALALMQILNGKREQRENSTSRNARHGGRGLQALEGFDTAFGGLQQRGATKLAETLGGSDVEGDRSFDLAIKFVLGREDGEWAPELILSQKSTHTVELGVGNAGLSVEVERSHRLDTLGPHAEDGPQSNATGSQQTP